MYERVYGAKYDKNLSTVEVAKRVRVEIKEAIKAGKLPYGKYSVTTERFSGGSSITISMKELTVQGIFNPDWLRKNRDDPHDYYKVPRYNEAARELLEQVEGMLTAYNHDGSDSSIDYFDVKFYKHVHFDHDWEDQMKETELHLLDMAPAAELPKVSEPEPANDTNPSPISQEEADRRYQATIDNFESRYGRLDENDPIAVMQFGQLGGA